MPQEFSAKPSQGFSIFLFGILILFIFFSADSISAAPQDEVWSSIEVDENIGSSFTLDMSVSSAYLGDFGGYLHQFDAEGGLLSSIDLGTAIQSSAAISPEGTLFVGSSGGDVYALTSDLSVIWQDTLPGEVTVSPALGLGGEVFFGTSSGLMVAYSKEGLRLWTREIFGYIGGSPAIGVDGTLLFGTDQGQLYGLDPTTGETRFVYETDEKKGIGSVAISNDGDIYFGTYDKALIALDSSGDLKWRYSTSGRVASAPVIDNAGRIYVAGYDSHLIEVLEDHEDAPSLVWSYRAQAPVYATPAVAEDQTVYVGDTEGNFYALNQNAPDRVSWQVSGASSYIASPVILDTGNILIVDTEGAVQAFEGNGFASAGDWPMSGLDQQRTANKFDIDGDKIFAFDDEDSDGDGMPDSWEHENGTQPYVADADEDLDGDIYTNLWEYENGTSANENEFDDRPLELLKAYSANSSPSLSLPDDVVDLVVSPDGGTLVVMGESGYQILVRDSNGELTETLRSYTDTFGASFSADDKDLYFLHQDNGGEEGIAQARFEGGEWVRQSFSEIGGENGGPSVGHISSVVPILQTTEGDYLYVGVFGSGVLVYERNADTGELSFVQQFSPDDSGYRPNAGMSLSPDNSALKMAGSGQTYIISRDPDTGMLTSQTSVATESSFSIAAGVSEIQSEGDWVAAFRTSDMGALEWIGDNDAIKHTIDTVPLSSSDLFEFNPKRSLIYTADARTTDSLSAYYLDPIEGFVVVDDVTTTDYPQLHDMRVLASSPQDDRLYVVSGSLLLEFSAGYKGLGRPDRDGDGVEDILDVFPDNPDEWADFDDDGIGDNSDPDIDGDGCLNEDDDLDFNPDECLDTDGDGIGNNADPDDDGDGYNDDVDEFPLDGSEWADADNDGIGDNEDLDDDNDGMPDVWELENNLDPYDDSDAGLNPDGDNLTNLEEYENGSDPALADTDGDGYLDHDDEMPRDDQEHIDTDGDGIGNNADTDDDGDGLSDECEIEYGFDPLVAAPEGQNTDGHLEPEGLKLTDAEECELGSDPTHPDGDGDGMPDVWELAYGLQPLVDDAQNDLDDDGYWNLLEYEQGTDPTINEFDDRSLEVLKTYSGTSTPALDLVDNVRDLVVSPDGETLVIVGSGGYQILSRDSNGELIEIQREGGNTSGALFSGDGQDLYLIRNAGFYSDLQRGVVQLRLEDNVWAPQSLSELGTSSSLSQPAINDFDNRVSLLESGNGGYLYIGARESGVLVYQRDAVTGVLTFVQQFMHDTYGFWPAFGMALSDDGSMLRVAGTSIHLLAVDTSTGMLSETGTIPVSSRGLLNAPSSEGWISLDYNNGRGPLELYGADDMLRQRLEAVPFSLDLYAANPSRSFVLIGRDSSSTIPTLSAYYLDSETGLVLFDQITEAGEPGLSEMDVLSISPKGDHLYVVAGDKLLDLEPGYKGLGHPDSDGDGYRDLDDAFPNDPSEWLDSDGDGYGDNADAFPNDKNEWADFDDDGVGDNSDPDIDGDGCLNEDDEFDFDPNECLDTDGDGVGNNEDPDDDGDRLPDVWEVENGLNPLDASDAVLDADGDGLTNEDEYHVYGTAANNPDSDGDGMDDGWEVANGLNPIDSADAGLDNDGDGFTNAEEYVVDTDPEDPRWYPGAPGLLKWKALTDASVRSKPLVDQNGTTYVGSIDGKVYAFDSDGNEIWVTNTGAAIEASPAMGQDGSIYVGTAEGVLLKVDPASPHEPTTLASVGAAIATTPATNNQGVLYFGADNGRLYAIDSSGNELWSYDAGSPVRSSPKVTSDGIVRFGDDSGRVHAIYGETGAPVQ